MNTALRKQILREWQPFGDHEAAANRPVAIALDRLVPQVMTGLGMAQRLKESQVFHQWSHLVGSAIAKHAQPVSLKKGLLVLAVDHPVWLNELKRYHKPLLLQKIRALVGKSAVADIVFRIG